MRFQIFACFLAASVLLAPTLAAICPESCICTTTRDGLHRATCSSLPELYKFTLRQKHHNINILDLSHNNITKLSHELDRLTEVVTLDMSTNGIQDLNKFLHNAKKLVHLNLSNNRIKKLSMTYLPKSVSSLDLTNNLLENVPSDLAHLVSLEHLEMEGNPLDCSCENIIARDHLLTASVLFDDVKCASPERLKGKSWLELKTKDICKNKEHFNLLDMMMGDQPLDPKQVSEDASALKSLPLVASNDLEDGKVISGANRDIEDDDSHLFLKVSQPTQSPILEGSGEYESTTISEINIEPIKEPKLNSNLMIKDEIIPANDIQSTDDPLEGSGSGDGPLLFDFDSTAETTTETYEPIKPVPITPLLEDLDDGLTTEFPTPRPISVFIGASDWNSRNNIPSVPTEKHATSMTPKDTTVSERISVTQPSEVQASPTSNEDEPPRKTGTYICIAIIVVLLVGLIGFAIIKGQMRKRRDRRLLRQQKRDVEKASKEMVDMNKSLLGKPAPMEEPIEKKANGKYELVPTHEIHPKKGENGDVSNGVNHNEPTTTRTDSPRDSNQNKSSSKDNNLANNDITPQQEMSFESSASPDLRKDSNSLASEEIFVPINEDDSKPNGAPHSDISQPLLNGDQNSDFLSPSREYVPVYSPDMGRVRIKLTETPKPKTPILVTRSRSNAGDIIITPSGDGNMRKSTT